MRITITCFTMLFLLAFSSIAAQTTKDVTVPMTATVNLSPNSIILNWSNPDTSNLLILRREKGAAGNQWFLVLLDSTSVRTTYTDNVGITLGKTYEYGIRRETSLFAFGYAHVAVRAPVTDNRGNIMVIVDSVTADAIGVELVRLKNDMRGDGWVATPVKIGPSATVQSVKDMIVAAYNADPQNLKAVLLIGDVPIPYSGNFNWDGHPEHTGAWPADSYYADIDGNWSDAGVNNTSPARDANDNIPGDGKFDQSYIPSAVELQVGRIDFRRINAPAFGEPDAIGLVRRYLDKNHAWRTGAYTVENKALVDDNFGYHGGEAFASDAYRNAYPLVGEANIVSADFFDNTNPQRWLLGYGCGSGNYQGAGGVGSSTDFSTDTVNIVFSNLFGSYFGDWDSETNPFMPSALASRGGILTCSWAGRPHWFNHALASGETIGYCHKETQNARFNNGFFQSFFGESGAHTALLGDPTLRAHVVTPPTDVVVANNCATVNIEWTEPGGNVEGYHIYRSLSNDGPYTRISGSMVTGTSFVDQNPMEDTLFYQVRSINTQMSPGGGIYLNNSVGPIAYLVHGTAVPPIIELDGGNLTCADQMVTLTATSDKAIASWDWSGPSGMSTDSAFVVATPGNYTLVVTDVDNCTAEGSIFVEQNTIPPVLNIAASNILTCLNTNATLSVTSSANLDANTFQWSTGASTESIMVNQPGTYSVMVNSLDNGCQGTATFNVDQDIEPPTIDFPSQLTYNCTNTCASLTLPNTPGIDYYLDFVLLDPAEPVEFCNAGFYSISAISVDNGCAADSDIEIIADVNAPGASIGASGVISCLNMMVQLMASPVGANISYLWSGPGINAGNANLQNPVVTTPGLYTLVVKDTDNGCTSTDQYTVATDNSLPQVTTTGGAITCSTFIVDLTCSTNIPNSTFLWTGPGGFSSMEQNPSTTFAGTYTVVVTSPGGCTNAGTAEVLDQAQAPDFGIPPIQELNCANPCVIVQLIPITPGLVIEPDTVCAPGTYMATVTGPNGCTAVATYLVSEAPAFSAALEPGFIDCDATITLSVLAMGGTMPYSYLWSNGATFSAALFLLDGSPISVTVSDSGGCVWESDTMIVMAPPPLSVSGAISNETAIGASDGSIMLNLTGGTPPFGFIWNNGTTAQNLTGVSGGTYTVIITELTTGCTAEASFLVGTTSAAKEAAFLQVLELAPNPSTGISVLSLKLDHPMPVKVEVRDATGRLIIENSTQTVKDMTLPIDLSQQASGVYHVSVMVANQVFVRKLVVLR